MDREDEKDEARSLSNRRILRFVGRLWSRKPLPLAISIAGLLFAVACELTLPVAAGRLIDVVSAGARDPSLVLRAWSLFAIVLLARAVAMNFGMRAWHPMTARNMRALLDEGFAQVQAFPTDWHLKHRGGATVRRLMRAFWGYEGLTQAVAIFLGPSILVLFGLAALTLWRDTSAGIFAIVVIAFFVTANLLVVARYIRPAQLASNRLDADIAGVVSDALSANALVKSFSAEPREVARLEQLSTAWERAIVRTWLRFTDLEFAQNLMLTVLQSGIIGAMAYAWLRGDASAGDVTFAVAAAMIMSGYLRNVGAHVRLIQKGLDDMEPAAAYAQWAPTLAERADATPFSPRAAVVEFDDVTFGYGDGPPLYRNLSFRIESGEQVAVVGATGAGKSTLVKLLQRFYDPQAGQIRIGGQDIASLAPQSLRRAIAVVPQDPILFHRTLLENITYGRPGAPWEEVEAAARKARIHEVITAMPHGYETVVGERGLRLSGGERQRVAIARAFLVDAPILIFDEATSALDVETEEEVRLALEDLFASRTTITIAHRLSSVRRAQRMLVFSHGRLVEDGEPAALIAAGAIS